MGTVTEGWGLSPLANAEPLGTAPLGNVLQGHRRGPFVGAIAKGLRLASSTRAPPICFASLHFDLDRHRRCCINAGLCPHGSLSSFGRL